MSNNPFSSIGNCVAVSASGTTGSAALPGSSEVACTVRVYNAAATVAFFKTGASDVTAATTDTFVAPGAIETFTIPIGHTHVAVILASSTGTVYVQRGSGA